MLESYFIRPQTIDQIKASWIGGVIERYVDWLAQQGYSSRTVYRRVPVLRRFGEFAKANGAVELEDLPDHVEAFVNSEVRSREKATATDRLRLERAQNARNSAVQMLRLVIPSYHGQSRGDDVVQDPFEHSVPGFFAYLRCERGLSEQSIKFYTASLRPFEAYLDRIRLVSVSDLSPTILSSFVAESSRRLSKLSLKGLCCNLRVFLRYVHREGRTPRDLSRAVGAPVAYRLANIPRSVTWDEVHRVLESVDRRTAAGKRDFAILLLLVTYGLRSREVAALTLDDIDWRQDRLRVPERKAGPSTAYPLSAIVGEAIVDYLQNGRPKTEDRRLFLSVVVPYRPMTFSSVSMRASYYLHKAGVAAPRLGSHTLRHTCVQRLVDADFPLKVIGDYVGHRSAASTEVYTKVAVEALRMVALGDGEDVL
ncbi:MAG: tyrosine-type recombinase/integrase [Candidatus Sericytochromatia bacterium]|nr:tyrosine-type recombinase/integrase [Candidatus Sericytochromatia bacterium]